MISGNNNCGGSDMRIINYIMYADKLKVRQRPTSAISIANLITILGKLQFLIELELLLTGWICIMIWF
jgi:hypothetical protein